ncbi:uncharacterized protein nkd [Tribolium castaneum]|nr:PREDICTED: uncharacterized protein LOC661080 [Tribolium castaneum]|eukprot:XP_008200263.1 PREDICTED: uncharacterized protein LOC661080 [Tribolium castaneum]
MDIWLLMHNSQMANNLVKWWKTKFLNGYKQFSVECGDGKVSDTEELLGRLGSEVDGNERLRSTTPPLPSQDETVPTPTPDDASNTPKKQPQHHLNFEEFSCDVSVEGGEKSKSGQERQEFSFTLYDFDGYGKITKDDIAGLVTTIYEALGSSVKVPHYGSKTIKVKLTVSPDQRKHVSATIINQKDNNEEKTQETSIRYKRDLNVTIRQGINEKRKHGRRQSKPKTPNKKHQCCNKHEEEDQENPFVSDDSSDACSRISGNLTSDEEEGECSDNERHKPKKHQKKCHRSTSPRYTIPNLFIKDANICNENNCSKKTPKKRSGSLQRQELLEIIQANMDKNNLGFQTPRKHSNHVSTQTRQLEGPHKSQSKSPKVSPSPLQYLANIVDPTHFYVDLASLQNTTQLPQTHCQYDKLIDAVMCVSNKKISLNKQKCRKHRVRNDLADIRYQFLQYPMTNDENKLNKPNKRTPKKSVSDVKKSPHVVTGHTSSPHHLRHKNRQEDQARAMAQVVRWLEQEFSSNLNTKEKAKGNHFHSTKEKTTSAPSSPGSGVERHEHHHVHEHIHHHYHHYQETPLVV